MTENTQTTLNTQLEQLQQLMKVAIEQGNHEKAHDLEKEIDAIQQQIVKMKSDAIMKDHWNELYAL
jgi:thioesterase domain-containing protein